MQDSGLYIVSPLAPCNCVCRHCLLESTRRHSPIAYPRVKSIVERFLAWKAEKSIKNFAIDFGIDYTAEFPEIYDHIRFRHQIGSEGAYFLQFNGISFRTKEMLVKWLSGIKKAGITTIGSTFFGVKEDHDRWVGRKGDYEFNILMNQCAATLGLKRVETIFPTQCVLMRYSELFDVLDAIPGLEQRTISLWDYRGRGKLLEPERMTDVQKQNASESLLKYFSRTPLKTEPEWMKFVQTNHDSIKAKRFLRLIVNETNIEGLERKSCDAIFDDLKNLVSRFNESVPSLAELASNNGDKDNRRLYRLRDLQWKWTDEYFKSKPRSVSTDIYSDLQSGVYLNLFYLDLLL